MQVQHDGHPCSQRDLSDCISFGDMKEPCPASGKARKRAGAVTTSWIGMPAAVKAIEETSIRREWSI